MIIITKIKSVETERDIYQLRGDFNATNTALLNPKSADECTLTIENITGKQFVNPATNERFVIGLSNKVSEYLGAPFKVIESLNESNENLRNSRDNLFDTARERLEIIDNFNNMSLIEHIKFWWKI